jgi:AraC-like DNA-binding protein
MAAQASDDVTCQFSTAVMPVRERVPFWREVFGRKLVHVDIEPLADEPFEATATLRALPGLRSLSCASTAARTQRTREFVADGDDGFALLINVNGTLAASQLGRDVSLARGEAAVFLHNEPATMTHALFQHEGLVMPRAALAPLVTNLEDMAMRRIPRDNGALRLLTGYLATVRDELGALAPELRPMIATHIHDLAAMVIGATRDGAAIAEERGVRAARLASIKTYIVAHAGDRGLTLAAVAAHHGLSPRSVQWLFERDDLTFSQFVHEQRLARAYRMLVDLRYAAVTVSDIALAAGFGDLSHFNRSFRRRYGATPSDLRARKPR